MERLSLNRGDPLVGPLRQALGELGDGGIQINLTHRHGRHARSLSDASAEARHQQGVRPEVVEEVVLGRNVVDFQHLGQGACEEVLAVGLGDNQFGAGRDARPLGLRQLPVIGLVAERHRDDRQFLEIGRNHVGRQPASQRVRDLAARQDRCILLERVIGHELDQSRLRLVGGHHRLRDLRQVQQHGFDFDEFDPIAAYLDLGIDPAVVFDLPVLIETAEVARPIDPLRRVVGNSQEIGNELPLRQLIAVQVAGREPDAGNPDLSKFPPGGGLISVRIENDNRIARERQADGHRFVRGQFRQRRGNGSLGRPVRIQDGTPGAMPADHQVVGAGLATDQQNPEQRQLGLDRCQQGRAATETRDPSISQEIREFVCEQGDARSSRDERRAGHQRDPDLFHGKVEGNRHALIDTIARCKPVALRRDPDEVANAGMLDDDAFGFAGRPRGIDDVTDPIDSRPDLVRREGRIGHCVDGLLSDVEKHLAHVERAESCPEAGYRYDGSDAGIRQDEANAFRRETGVERHIGGVDLHHRQQRDIGLDRFVEQKADPVAGFDPLVDQVSCDPVGTLVEVAIRHNGLVSDDRVVRTEPQASLLHEMMKPLSLPPTNGVVLVGQYRG